MAQQNLSEEVNLGYVFNKFNTFLKNAVRTFFAVIGFYIKFWIIVLVLILLGLGYGYYLNSSDKGTFISEGIVIPNFESVDYLYENIAHINSKISQGDTIFLKQLSPNNYESLSSIEVEPILDIYNFATKSREQIDVFRILFQNQEYEKFINDNATSKYYKYHKISFTTSGEEDSKELIEDIFKYWNSNDHFVKYENAFYENTVFQIAEYKKMVAQIDSIINTISTASGKNSNTGVIISENRFDLLFVEKRNILDNLLEAEVRLSDYSHPIKKVYMNYDIESKGLSNTIKYPIIFVGLFSLIFFFVFVFKKLRKYADL